MKNQIGEKTMIFNSKLAKISIVIVLMVAAVLAVLCAPAYAEGTVYFDDTREYAANRFLVMYDVNSSFKVPDDAVVLEEYAAIPGLLCIKVTTGDTIETCLKDWCALDGVLWAEPDYRTVPIVVDNTPTTAEIIDSYPQDRIAVHYHEENYPEILSTWDIITKYTEDYGPFNVTYAVLKIPAGMSFREAIAYCNTNKVSSIPHEWFLGNHTTITYGQDVLAIYYKDSKGYETQRLPEEMTLPDAINYYSQLDEVMFVDLVPTPVPLANVDNTIGVPILEFPETESSPAESPISILIILAGLIGCLILVRKY